MRKSALFVTALVAMGTIALWAQDVRSVKTRGKGIRFQIHTPDPPLPERIIVRIDGRDIAEAEYGAFLEKKYSMREFASFLDETLIVKKAAELKLTIDEKKLDTLVDAHIERQLERFKGSEVRYRAYVAERFHTPESYRQYRRERRRTGLIENALALAMREVTDDDVKKKFAEMYGSKGIIHQVRHILIGIRKRSITEALSVARLTKDALDREPDLFIDKVRELSDDKSTQRTNGLIAGYRAHADGEVGPFGKNFDEAVLAMEREGEIIGPVKSNRGYHIIQLVRRDTTQLENVAADIRKLLEEQESTSDERRGLLKKLRAEARIEF